MVIDSLRAGGKERQLIELSKGLRYKKEIKYELAVMSDKIHYTEAWETSNKIYFLIRKVKKDPIIFFKLLKICKEFKPNIIQTWDSMTSIYALPVAKFLGIKLINFMIRDAPSQLHFFDKSRIRSKLTFPFSDIIVSNSYAGLQSYEAPTNKSICIHNGFDFSRIENLLPKKIIKEKFGIKNEKVIGMVASFSENKDYKTYFKSAENILSKNDKVIFLSIGDGPNLKRCQNMVNVKFKDKIKFLRKQKNIESIVNIFDIGVLATFTEGIPNSIMEYMALGKPVVATNGGGINELVVDGVTGFLVESENIYEMVEKIEFLLKNENVARSMGNKGKERLIKEFDLDRMTDKFITLYQKLLISK